MYVHAFAVTEIHPNIDTSTQKYYNIKNSNISAGGDFVRKAMVISKAIFIPQAIIISMLLVLLAASVLSGIAPVGHNCAECSDSYYSLCPAHIKQSELLRNISVILGVAALSLAALALWQMYFSKIINAGHAMSPISLKVRLNN